MLVVREWNSKMFGKRLHGFLLLLVFLLANVAGTCNVAFAAVVASISFSLPFLIIEIPNAPENFTIKGGATFVAVDGFMLQNICLYEARRVSLSCVVLHQ